jgi:HAD superfamily hydrolase (TIGR01450 family)
MRSSQPHGRSTAEQHSQPRVAGAGAPLAASDRPLPEIYRTALIDLDGVVYRGSAAVPHAVRALVHARRRGLRTVFLTNNASRTPAQVAELLGSLGIPAAPADVVTSAQAAASLAADCVPAGSRVLVIGGMATEGAVAERSLVPVRSADDAPVAVVQGFSPEVDWRQLAEAAYAVARGIPWFASNTDLVVPRGPGNAPGNGTLVNAVRTVTGRDPVVAGKPHAPIFAEALRRGPGPYLVVGDGLDTDIEGASTMGLDSLLVLTGVTTIGKLASAPPRRRPAYLAADLRGLLDRQPSVLRQATAWRCGAWTAAADADTITLRHTGAGTVTACAAELTDGARALCQAAWDRADSGIPTSLDEALRSWQASWDATTLKLFN